MTSARRLPRRLLSVAAAAIAALLLSSCTATDTAPAPFSVTADAATIGQVPAELMDYYAQAVTWSSCSGGFQCAEVEVPMDYAKPGGDTLKLSVIRLPASGERRGAILINPGGPGASGVNMAKNAAKSYFSDTMRDAYDIVGFDPRGVQRSSPIQCLDDAQMDAARQVSWDLSSDAGLQAAEAASRAETELCVQNSGEVLAHVDTVSAAKDLDILRAAAGDAQLNYMGFSYGTKLGATYAGLFPGQVGKFSLDGALDPAVSIDEMSMGQAVGFENALRAWAQACLGSQDCPVSGDVDAALAQIRELHQAYAENPPKTPSGRVVTGDEFLNAIAYAMYSTELWDMLAAGLAQAFEGDASGMLLLADYSADRNSDGKYQSNSMAAFTAINCLDYPVDSSTEHMRADAAALEAASPTFGSLLAYSGLSCKFWPFPATGTPAPITADGAGPILVIGTTGDPATPYQWAETMAEQLSSGVLVSWDGDGHTAYGRANSCLTDVVDQYFVEGVVPADGTRC